jgi:hypothetical protein
VFSCDFRPRNSAENVTLYYNVLSCFFDKEIINKLSVKLIGTQNNTRMPEVIFRHVNHLWGHGHLSQNMKFTQFWVCFYWWALCVIDHNPNMGGVDLKDQFLHMYMVKRKKMTRWYLKLFKRLLNCTVLNSFVVCRQVTGRNIQQFSYRIRLVEGLFTKYARAAETRIIPRRQASNNTVSRLTERHFLRKVAPKSDKSKPQSMCVLCSKHGKKNTSVYCCQICDVGLCLEDCFELYHTMLNYWGNDNYFAASI